MALIVALTKAWSAPRIQSYDACGGDELVLEVRHHVLGEQLVGALRRLEVGEVAAEAEEARRSRRTGRSSRWIWAIAMSGVPMTAEPDSFISLTRPSYVVAVARRRRHDVAEVVDHPLQPVAAVVERLLLGLGDVHRAHHPPVASGRPSCRARRPAPPSPPSARRAWRSPPGSWRRSTAGRRRGGRRPSGPTARSTPPRRCRTRVRVRPQLQAALVDREPVGLGA